MADKLNINEWAAEDRPRERLIAQGPSALSNAELLALLIGSGTREETAVDLMKRVLADCSNNLNTLGRLSLQELMAYRGIGEAKAVVIAAACELGRRRAACAPERRPKLGSAQAIYEHMRGRIAESTVEESWVMLMKNDFSLLRDCRLSRGGLTETAVDVRLIIREAVLSGATVIALAHNHPSGNPTPSRDDDRLTRSVADACRLMRLHMADHVIVTDGAYYSYAEQGKL